MSNAYVALLRAVNVGGTGKLPMSDLKQMCEKLGFKNAKTYIASGNVVFQSDKAEAEVKKSLEKVLHDYASKPVGVMVRTRVEMQSILESNPFANEAPNRVVAIFLDQTPASDALDKISGQKGERCALGTREIYVHYGDGMADTKLKIPAAKDGTARNINTVRKLVEMIEALK